MKTLGVGNLKAQFSEVVKQLQKGQEFALSYGKRKEIIGFFVPRQKYLQEKKQRTLGVLQQKGKLKFASDFEISDEEFLTS